MSGFSRLYLGFIFVITLICSHQTSPKAIFDKIVTVKINKSSQHCFESPEREKSNLTECPQGQRSYVENGICYYINKKGPCLNNLVFQAINKTHGDCDCPLDAMVPYVYYPYKDFCYKIFSQAYCAPGEWLVYQAEDSYPNCTKNECQKLMDSLDSEDLEELPVINFLGTCGQLGSHSKLCHSKVDVLIIKPGEVLPSCASTINFALGHVSKLNCRKGTRFKHVGRCGIRSTVKIDFGDD